MAQIPHEFIYRGNLAGLGAFHSQVFVDALAGGQITSVYFEAQGVSGFSGDWFFGLQVNGVDVLAGADRVQITSGDLEVEKTGLAIAVNFRDRIAPTVDERGAGTITGPITVIIYITPTAKTTPVDADSLGITDSADSNRPKTLSFANLWTWIKGKADTFYVALTGAQTIAGVKTFSSSPIVPTPSGATDAANKSYVDGIAASISWKSPVRVATTAAGTLATSFENGDTIDGVVLATGDRILIKNQAAPAENGIYIVAASGAPTRATDADSGTELVNASCYVSEGTTNADKQFVCTTNAPITVGSTSLTFVEFSSGGGGAFNDLTDVVITGATAGEVPYFNGTNWVNNSELGAGQAKFTSDLLNNTFMGDVDSSGNDTLISVNDTVEAINIRADQIFEVLSENVKIGPTTSFGFQTDVSGDSIARVGDATTNIELNGTAETIAASKDVTVPDEVYDATAWNGSLEVPTKNAVRDKIEAITAGTLPDGDYGDITVSGSGTVMNIDAGVVGSTELATAVNPLGKQTVYIPASAMIPATTNGPASAQLEAAGGQNYSVLDFDATTAESAHFQVAFPKGWNEGTVSFQPFWSSTATDTDGVAIGLEGCARSDNEAITGTWGTQVIVTDDAQSAAAELYVGAESAVVTIGGSPAADDLCFFRIQRVVSDGNDDMSEDMRLIGIKLFYTIHVANDA